MNTPPTLGNLEGDTVTYNEGAVQVLVDELGDAIVSDADSPDFNGGSLTVSIASNGDPGEDVLLFNQVAGGVSISGGTVSVGGVAIGTLTSNGTGGNDLVVAFNASATAARVQVLVRAIAYTNTDNVNPTTDTRQITIRLVDGDGGEDTAIVSTVVIVNPVNDPPAGADGTIAAFHNAHYVFAQDDFGFTDQDGNNLLEVIFTGATGGTLYIDSGGNGFDAGDAVTSFPRSVGVSLINAGQVAFVPNTVGTGTGSVAFQVRDDGGTANGGQDTDTSANTLTFNVTSPSANPDLQLTDTLNYTENAAASLIAPNGIVTDSDSPNFNGGTLTVTFAANGTPNDELGIRNQGTGAGQIGVSGADVTFQGTVIGTFTGGGSGGGDLVVTFDADATPAAVQALVRNLTYFNGSDDPSTLSRTVNITVTDGGGGTDTASAQINVAAVNDPALAQNDNFGTDEATAVNGNLFIDNGWGEDSDVDGPSLTVAAVNGSGANVGSQITLPSGALLTVNANGTFTWNPNGAFTSTPTPGSGASNQPAIDSFTYTLSGGGTATVTLSIDGLDNDDVLFGNASANTLSSGIGNDVLNGLGGADMMIGGTGNDSYVVDHAGDVVIEAAGGGGFDAVYTSVSYTLTANQEIEGLAALIPSATTPLTLVGNGIANYVVGNAGINTIDGGAGADTMEGLGGNDSYVVDHVGDRVIEAAGGGGFDAVYSAISYTLAAGQQIEGLAALIPSATTALNLTGNEIANYIVGNAGVNQIDGGASADTLEGLGGNDNYVIDNAGDRIIEAAGGGGFDAAYTSVSYTLSAGQEIEGLATLNPAATTALNLTGNAINNYIVGNAGTNTIDGGAGNDTLEGGGGNDNYVVDSAGDVIIEAVGGGGFDAAYTSVSYTLGAGANVEGLATLNPAATTALNLTGNEIANYIVGNAGTNQLDGKGGNDTLEGGTGTDIYAFTAALGAGNVDTLVGYSVADDVIVLDDAVFTGLALGALNPNAFRSGTSAQDADDRIIYDPATGNLFFDADGNGVGAAIQFATVQGAPPLTAGEFIVG